MSQRRTHRRPRLIVMLASIAVLGVLTPALAAAKSVKLKAKVIQ